MSSIPLRKCFRCGELTNQTQSVLGVMHTSCFRQIHTPTASDVVSAIIRGLSEVRAGTRTIEDLESEFKIINLHKVLDATVSRR